PAARRPARRGPPRPPRREARRGSASCSWLDPNSRARLWANPGEEKMWDRLLVDCRIATLEAAPGNPLGLIDNGAIGISDGKIVRVGKRTELAGFRARDVVALGGAWVTPGLIDCHTHLIFGGTRADEHAMRRAGATYEEIAKAGGGIASTVKRTAGGSDEDLLDQSRRRLRALMHGGCTPVEIKSGYGLDPTSE